MFFESENSAAHYHNEDNTVMKFNCYTICVCAYAVEPKETNFPYVISITVEEVSSFLKPLVVCEIALLLTMPIRYSFGLFVTVFSS